MAGPDATGKRRKAESAGTDTRAAAAAVAPSRCPPTPRDATAERCRARRAPPVGRRRHCWREPAPDTDSDLGAPIARRSAEPTDVIAKTRASHGSRNTDPPSSRGRLGTAAASSSNAAQSRLPTLPRLSPRGPEPGAVHGLSLFWITKRIRSVTVIIRANLHAGMRIYVQWLT